MPYLIHILILFAIYAILGISLNLVMGYTGLISVAHAAFFAVGAYATALCVSVYGFSFASSVLIGMCAAALLAVAIARVLSGLKSDYYMLGTLGFTFVLQIILINWISFTGGPMGITGISRPSILGVHFAGNEAFLLLTAMVMVAVYAISRAVVLSSFGRVIRAIRENELVTRIFGYETIHYKIAVFVIAAMMAAVAGSLYASYIRFIDPGVSSPMESVFIISIVILGGLANLQGSILGAFILILIPELLRFIGFGEDIASQIRQLLYGLLLVVLMRFRPQGLRGEYKL